MKSNQTVFHLSCARTFSGHLPSAGKQRDAKMMGAQGEGAHNDVQMMGESRVSDVVWPRAFEYH